MPQSKVWREVVALLADGADVESVAGRAAHAARAGLASAADDPEFLLVMDLLVRLPLAARGPGFHAEMDARGVTGLDSVPGVLAGLSGWIDDECLARGYRSDIGEIGRAALLTSLSEHLGRDLPGLFAPTDAEIRHALGRMSSGDRFASLARTFFSETVSRTLDYFLSRELSNHVGPGRRFASDAERVAFDRALRRHSHESARIIEACAGGWYGKTVWREGALNGDTLRRFTAYSMTKLRQELERRDDVATG